ncbi:DUF975 family protein [Paenibacillus sp. strain BS8-2]
MWTRSELKSRAKSTLRNNYWKAFLVSLILGIAGGGCNSGSANFNLGSGGGTSSDGSGWNVFGDISWAELAPFLIIGFIIFLLVLAFALALRIFLLAPLEVGGLHFFKRAAEEESNMGHLGYAFGNGRYGNIVKTMFWRGLLQFLWTLLFIIPGIIKSYAYSQVPYILSDNPGINYRRAVQLSNQMTRGHKFRIFVLDLSFLGWILLGILALFVGVLFVMPYIYATKAELYLDLRQEALQSGITTLTELRLNDGPTPL